MNDVWKNVLESQGMRTDCETDSSFKIIFHVYSVVILSGKRTLRFTLKNIIAPFCPQFRTVENPSGKPDGIWQNET